MNTYRYVYVLRSLTDKMFYVGFTKDLKKRVQDHSDGLVPSTKRRRPFELVYWEGLPQSSGRHATRKVLEVELGQAVYQEPASKLSHGVKR